MPLREAPPAAPDPTGAAPMPRGAHAALSDGGCAVLLQNAGPLPALGEAPAPILQLAAVRRYPVDPSYAATLRTARAARGGPDGDAGDAPGPPPAHVDAYDVVLLDGRARCKVALAPELNALVERGAVRPGAVVQVKEWLAARDEHTLGRAGFVLVTELEYIAQGELPAELPAWSVFQPAAQLGETPLLGARAFYLSAWSDDCVEFGPEWREADLSLPEGVELPVRLASIATVVGKRRHRRPPHPTLVGRVLAKSRLFHYAQAGRAHKLPLRFEITLADKSLMGGVRVVFWNSLCVRYFCHIAPGDILAIRGFKMRPDYADPSQTELSIDSSDSVRVCKLLSHPLVHQCPRRWFALRTLDELRTAADGTVCDLVGRAVLVGRWERQRVRNERQLSRYRWISLLDQTGDAAAPLQVKVYTCSRSDRLGRVEPGNVIMLTNIELCSVTVDALAPRQVYAVTSSTTELILEDALPYEPAVNETVRWAACQPDPATACRDFLEQCQRRPRTTRLFAAVPRADLLDTFRRANPKVPVVPVGDLPGVRDALHFEQITTVLVQARIVELDDDRSDVILASLNDPSQTISCALAVDVEIDSDSLPGPPMACVIEMFRPEASLVECTVVLTMPLPGP